MGDLGGFVASTYMRGIDFYNVPTTLLSQVDSSIGGKNAIDFEGIKNVIGTFKQPKAVLIDPDVLSTLDKRQLHNGLAESIKMGATLGEDLFGLLEGVSDINAHMDRIIIRSIQLKRGIVEQDEKEKNIRKVLNFGHTFGHAIEAISNGEFLHGEAVGIGMLICSTGEAKRRIENVLVKFDLPVDCPYSFDELLPLMKEDKKGDGDYVDLVSCSSIGRYSIDKVAFPYLRGRLR